ncbi:tRNA (adenosine(37)-N6)-threonylcarbamoyltransferase complex ATPase subunit type 1 TsaE [Anaerococcus sp. NML200537]|uniref:tRNA (adenosine(37)-N6)-threonylcarbamoyltransferase complex ATPase subunit type 1 TsaE n=1 Tax=Anaerococcus sp. NML200537 TaxID=2954485 RepID=UPI00223765FC|nr:tRNA (adenosine(37)-N6)-threonylcarbamoyltransferase complex ATPase subunit type 1 TsaE [Anaerococcus sp. NML200537]MCW6702235.1 tRNA (adenosine(37)-N6)-threonylcarbamoyltransferase complex ATPase subunit type 1 TsaE [Anaerococcus sp. NML200537]
MIINNLEELKKFADKLAPILEDGDVINLKADMGCGKTTLVTAICKNYGINDTSSPTFALVNIYEGDRTVYHLDLYRFEDPDEILDIDFETYFYPEGAITFLEWAENVSGYLPDDMIDIEIKKLDENRREIRIADSTERARKINELLSN